MSEILPGVAPLTNVAALETLVRCCVDRTEGLPGMATFYGPSGDGKSYAAIYVRHKFDAVLVQVKSTWAKKDLCENILKEMGILPRGRIAQMAEEIAENLLQTDRVLLVDEADYAAEKKMVEVLRDIYEGSFSPVILIGEEKLPQKLTRWERLHNRMLAQVGTQPASETDAKLLARLYAQGIDIDAALLARLMAECHGSVRRMVVNINHVREFAMLHGINTVTLGDWADRDFQTGHAPQPRNGTMRRAGII